MNRIIVFSVLTIIMLFGTTSSILVQPVNAAPEWWNENWERRIELTINSDICNDQDLEDFPVLVQLINNPELKTNALDSGDDIAFTDSDWQQLDHEIEFFNGTTGTLYAWVRIPSLPTTTSKTIYMYYNNTDASNQENPTGVWDSNYKMVQHLSETAGIHYDSTSNNNHGTPFNGTNQDVNVLLDGGDKFDGNDDFIDFGSDSSLSISDQITFEAWIKPNSASPPEDWDILIRADDSNGSIVPYRFYLLQTTGNLSFASSFGVVDSSQSVSSIWHHIAITVDNSSSIVQFYIDGVNILSPTGNLGADFPGTSVTLASFNNSNHFGGFIDEVRLSNTVRDGCWIRTSYENQNSPSSFVTNSSRELLSAHQSEVTINSRDAKTSSLISGSGIIQINGSSTTLPNITDWITGSTLTLEALSPITISGQRYSWTSWVPSGTQTHYYTVLSGSQTVTAYYAKQFYLTVESAHDTPLGEGWYDEDTIASYSIAQPIVDYPNATRYICMNYTVNGGTTYDGFSGTIPMDSNQSIVFNWQEYILNSTVIIETERHWGGKEAKVDGTEYDTEIPPEFIWTNTTVHEIEALNVEVSAVNRFVWDYWRDFRAPGPAVIVADPNPRTYVTPDPDGDIYLTAFYQEQFYLTVNSDYGNPQGEGWYDRNLVAMFNVTSPFEVNGTRYTVRGYTEDGGPLVSRANGTITMNTSWTITFLWEDIPEYYLTVNSAYGTAHGEGWYTEGDTPTFYVTPELIEVNGTRHVFQGWTGDYIDGANPAGAKQILMDGPKTVTAVWRDRFFIEIISPYGSPKGSSWPFKGENFEVSVTSPDSGYVVTGFKLDGGSLQPGAKYMFVNVQEPHTIQFFWEILTETTVFTLDCDTNPSSKGTIVVGTTVYNDGESLTTLPGIYNIQANPDDDYSFTRWQTSGGVSVANSGSSTTTVTLAGDGTLTMIQQILGVAPPPGVWGGPETQFQCIIATAAYGGTMAPEVVYMRNVRDNMIGSTPIGNILVSGFNTFYYSWSPPVAQWIAGSEGLRTTFRVLLLPISASVHSAELTYTTVSPFNPTMASVTAFLLAAAISIGSYIIVPIFAGLTIYRKKYASHT